jgi:hypothetical protein
MPPGLRGPWGVVAERELLAFAGDLIGALVVDAWCTDLDRTGGGEHIPRLVVAVPDDQTAPGRVVLVGEGAVWPVEQPITELGERALSTSDDLAVVG